MRVEEARWIETQLSSLPAERLSPLVELGSQTLRYRTVDQPHVDAHIGRPLRERGVRIIHSDLQSGDGVDISGDILEPAIQARLAAEKPRAVICCNILSHVTDRATFARVCDQIMPPGGVLVASAPWSYPLALDPIDNRWRPSPSELASLFPSYRVLAGEIVRSNTYLDELVREPRPWLAILRALARVLVPVGGFVRWRVRAHRFFWLFRPFQASVVVLEKPETPRASVAGLSA